MNRKQIIRNLRALNIAFNADASTPDLHALLERQKAMNRKVLNFANGKGKIEVVFNAANEDPAEIMICEEIGKDPWSGEGVTAKDIQAALNEITPKTRPLNFLTNSPGGSVNEGCAIRNILQQWPGRITNTIIGIAASTASWCIPADEVRAYKSSQMFLHRSWGMVCGNADDMRSAITFLETTDTQISEMLADQSEATPEKMMDLMKQETLLTGQQAKDLGLVNVLIDGEAKNQFSPEQLNAMKLKLAALNSARTSAPPQGEQNKPTATSQNAMKEKIALLNKRGLTPPANATEPQLDELISASNIARNLNASILTEWGVTFDAENSTDEQLKALVKNGKPAAAAPNQPTIEDLQRQVQSLQTANSEANRVRITAAVDQLIQEDKLQNNLRDEAIEDCIKNPTRLEKFYNKLQPKPPGAAPVGPLNLEITGDASLGEIQNHILNNSSRLREKFIGARNAEKHIDEPTRKAIGAGAILAANAIAKHKPKIIAAWNTNTISADLQRQVILQDMLEAFDSRLVPITAFAHTFNNVPLEKYQGKVVVAYYPLQTAASRDFNGTYTMDDTNVEDREVTVDKRKYLGFAMTSQELRQLPYVNWAKLSVQNAQKLAQDVFTDIVQNVITAANFGASVKAVPAAMFTPDDVADLWENATGRNWPDQGRSLVLNHTYKTSLLKDPTFKSALAYGSTDPVRRAMIQEAYGFENIHTVPNLVNYSPADEFLNGWINHESAVLVATSPILPSEDVRAVMSRYDVVTNPKTGLSIEYRRWGAPGTDTTNELVEFNYGRGKGVDAALARITSQ